MKLSMCHCLRWCVITASLLLSGCVPSEEQPQPNTHLPGFDVWMPTGIVVKQSTHPAVGSYQVRSGTVMQPLPQPFRSWLPERAPSTKVSWKVETVEYSDPVDIAQLLDGAMSGLATGKGRVVSAGDGRWISVYEFGNGKVIAGFARCEPWLNILFIIGLEGDVSDETVALKMVRSVTCRLGDQPPPSLQISLSVPEHFGLAANTDQPTYFSTSGGGLVTSYTDGNIARDYKLLKQVLGGMLSAGLGAKSPLEVAVTPIERADGAPSTLSVLSGEMAVIEQRQIQVGTLYCKDLDSTAMVMIFAGEDPRTDPLQVAKSLQCPNASRAQAPQETIDAVFSPICESGDLSACQYLIGFIQAGNADGSVMSLERARQQACALGDSDHCV